MTPSATRVLLFGAVAERVGKRACTLTVEQEISVDELIRQVGCAGMEPLLVAVNQEQMNNMQSMIKAGDEVAIMPPYSGG